MWVALPFQALSGLVFIFARPASYFVNPVFRTKFTLLAPALVLAFVVHRAVRIDPRFWERSPGRRRTARIIAALSLALWLGVVLAGRWIAYADYLFPELGL
jgi:drug/metabolite transporter (DMT)-like permease